MMIWHEAPSAPRYSQMSFEMDGNPDQLRASARLSRIELAKLGEEHAAKLVASLGYQIVKRNFRYGKVGEIDIVAYDGECLVFIEVKARQDHSHGTPESSIDVRKQAQLKKVARMYYYVNAIQEAVCRFDVVAVDIFGKKVDIRHHKNAFS
jgi:putative endonuclease